MKLICTECGKEYDSLNYKNILCDPCYNKGIERTIEKLRKSLLD